MTIQQTVADLQNGITTISEIVVDRALFEKVTASLKERIHAVWEADKDQALLLADLLLDLNRNHHSFFAVSPSTDKAYLERLAHQAVTSPSTFQVNLLHQATVASLILLLKAKVDAYRWRDNQRAMDYARAIIRIGEQQADKSQIALGLMALGDSIATLGNQQQKAWDTLQQAAGLFLQNGDLIGWARTTIGRVGICTELDRAEEAMRDAALASEIFQRYGKQDLFARLAINRTRVFNDLGRFRQSIRIFEEALPALLAMGEAGEDQLGLLYNNVGNAYRFKGDFHQARRHFESAIEVLTRQGKGDACNIVNYNIAHIELSQGRYQQALNRLHQIMAARTGENSIYTIHVKLYITECYLALNKDVDARDLAQEILRDFSQLEQPFPYELAHTLRYLAMAEAKLGHLDNAEKRLGQARDLFSSLQAETWTHFVALQQAHIALCQGQNAKAEMIASEAATFFEAKEVLVNLARANLLRAQCQYASGEVERASFLLQLVRELPQIAQLPELQHGIHLLAGQLLEAQGQPALARQHYKVAMRTIEQLQGNLTITLRPGFFEDKNKALHAYLRLALAEGQVVDAFETLEWSKSQVLLGYLANRQRLYWSQNDPTSRALIQELARQREEHHVLYRMCYEMAWRDQDEPDIEPALAQQKLASLERRLRQITEQLYLLGAADNGYNPAPTPGLAAIQEGLPPDSTLVEYYNDGKHFRAFIVNCRDVVAFALPINAVEFSQLIDKLYFNIKCILGAAQPDAVRHHLTYIARRIGQKLYDAIIRPLPIDRENSQRLIIVPYGVAHYLPFNWLHDGHEYLIEHHEIVMMPAAGLLTRPAPRRRPGGLVLAHSDNGRLPHAQIEAQRVHTLLSGQLHLEEKTSRALLAQEPLQILHIAAHGKHRLDQPDFSFVQLADGELFTDDLLQHDLSYELVTLSACETGRAIVKEGEELIGLGRGVLCAGAGALVASLWRVEDTYTAELMQIFYQALQAGQSKAGALRTAQRQLLQADPALHPAFWSAFQLIGNADPLSTFL